MKVGRKVKSELYPEYGTGKIISKREVFDDEFYEVFFEDVGKTVELQEEDLKLVKDAYPLFRSNSLSSPAEFKLHFLAQKIESIILDETLISPVNFKIKPIPHQLLAVDFVVGKFKPRCLLADEVGLGKTIEAALILEELKMRNIAQRILIITPAGLTNQWKDEMKLKFSEDFHIFDRNSFKAFQGMYGEKANYWQKFDKVITSIDFVKPRKIKEKSSKKVKKRRKEHNEKVFKECVNAQWDMVIIDEAHKLSKYKDGAETARYKLASALSDSVPVYLLLSATPHRGKPHVFKNLLRLIDPYRFNDLADVRPENVKEISVKNKKRSCIDFEGNRLFKDRFTSLRRVKWKDEEDEPERKLYQAVSNYVSEYYNYAERENNTILKLLLMLYQRIVSSSSRAIMKSLKKRLDTLKEISSSVRKIQEGTLDEFVDLDGESQLESLQSIMPVLNSPEKLDKEIKIIQHCIKLAKNATIGRKDAKLRELMDILDKVKKQEGDINTKFLIFTEFIETQKEILESLEKIGYETSYINGHLSLDERLEQKRKFKNDAQIMVSTDAGGEGINLQFCHVVINYDLPWNPMKLEQRIGRADRIGQEKDVVAFNLILADTVESYVRQKIEEKLEIIKKQFGEDKLRDILSTLDEEVNFDKIYMTILTSDKSREDDLKEISEKLLKKAEDIVNEDKMLIPFNSSEDVESYKLEKTAEYKRTIKSFTETFLKYKGDGLKEYKKESGLYYFENNFRRDKFPSHFSKVIFDQDKGIEYEDANLFSYDHPFISSAVKHSQGLGKASKIEITYDKFKGKKGVLFNWVLTITNNFGMTRKKIVPVFIDSTGDYSSRISRFFESVDHTNFRDIERDFNLPVSDFYEKAKDIAEEDAKNVFFHVREKWNNKIKKDKENLEKYFEQRRKAVSQIKIDNIKRGKRKKMKKGKTEKLLELKKKKKLFPELNCDQIAYVEFG